VPGPVQKDALGGVILQTNHALVIPGITIGESTLYCLLIATLREDGTSTECWLVVGDPCKDTVTSVTVGGKVTLLMMSMSMLMLSWAVVSHDLAVRVTTSRRYSSIIGVASCTKPCIF